MIASRLAGLCAVGAVAVVAAGGASATSRVSVPLPPLSSFGLAPADFSAGGAVASEVTTSVGGTQVFARVFKPGRYGSTHLLTAVSLALIDSDASAAAGEFAQFKAETRTATGRQALAKQWGLAFVAGVKGLTHGKGAFKVKHTAVGLPVVLGASAFRLPLTITTSAGSLHVALEVTQTDRVLAMLELMPDFNHTFRAADATAALAAVQQHLHDAFTVANTSPPVISGTAAQAQVITLDEGSWTGVPSGFSYAWSHCDAVGANCTPIAGATGKTYTVGAADVGYSLRVTVVGTNSVGSQEAMSAATAAIT